MTKKSKTTLSTLGTALLIALAPLTFNACGQDYNSNSSDDILSIPLKVDCNNVANTNLCAAASYLQKRCFRCHRNWSEFDSTQDYIDAGLVILGQPTRSEIVDRLVNSGGDMPPTGGALPKVEYDAIVNWVTLGL